MSGNNGVAGERSLPGENYQLHHSGQEASWRSVLLIHTWKDLMVLLKQSVFSQPDDIMCRNRHCHIEYPCLPHQCEACHQQVQIPAFISILQEQLEAKEEQLDSENRQFTERIKKLGDFSDELNTLVNTLHTRVKGLEREKEALQNEVQVVKTEVCTYVQSLLIYQSCLIHYVVSYASRFLQRQ